MSEVQSIGEAWRDGVNPIYKLNIMNAEKLQIRDFRKFVSMIETMANKAKNPILEVFAHLSPEFFESVQVISAHPDWRYYAKNMSVTEQLAFERNEKEKHGTKSETPANNQIRHTVEPDDSGNRD